jgi:hypothetical protein
MKAAVLIAITSTARLLAASATSLLGIALVVGLASVGFGLYSQRIKQRLRWTVHHKGHTILFDGSGFLAERLYLNDGLVRQGGVGLKMQIRTTIKAGDGIGDEIVVWHDALLFSCRCRIVAEEQH